MSARQAPVAKHRRKRVSRRAVFLGLAIIMTLLPIFWTILASFNIKPVDASSSAAWLVLPSFDQYVEVGVAEPHFANELMTGTALSAVTTLLTTAIAFFAAYAIARSHFRGRRVLVQSLLILASLPVISYVISLKTTLDTLHLSDTFIGTALPETALYLPLATYVLFGYLNEFPAELEESAQIDGALPLQILRRIVVPVIAPSIAATAIIVFVLSWNQLLLPLILATTVRTIPVAMIDFFTFERELDWPTAAAALIASLLPIGIFVAVSHPLLEHFSLRLSEQTETNQSTRSE